MRALRALSRVPPPLLFVAPLLIGLRVNAAHPWAIAPAKLAESANAVGTALVMTGVALALSAIGLFIRVRTTIIPHHRSRSLVTAGPFRLTRNPMYVALSTVFVGASLVMNAVWPLMLVALPLIYLNRITIPREEALLREAFGTEYDAYSTRVRRWL